MTLNGLEQYARLALDGIHREYPYHLSRLVLSPDAIEAPRSMTPVFYGCFDWHSAVHGHWLLALTLRLNQGTPFADRCHEALSRSFHEESILIERDHLVERPGFERPYGLAWLLALVAELNRNESDDARAWRRALTPLEYTAREHLVSWLPKLPFPIRCGTHAQTAFSMGLVWDWAHEIDDTEMISLLRDRAIDFYGEDHDYPLHLEPSGEDFLSGSLGAASIMSRVLESTEFASWMDRTMPGLARETTLAPATNPDPSDGRLTHLDGLNLSRAWMLWDVFGSLPADDPRREGLQRSARDHAERGLQAVSTEHYAGSHWLGTFAAYLGCRMLQAGVA
ncbi:MAG: hypothetical protein CMJ40_03410 [Phycisphaerae bacterium]|nr:hypothetical protein [Phycisphaerae bacterium]|tara:strand:+ start:591 stop:1601 length:1011 start_codon:yes stop_codon:yes gene_type:complete